MRLMLASRAEAEAIAEVPTGLAANCTRDDVRGGGYVHDVYEGIFQGTLERALERLFSYDIFPAHRMRSRVFAPGGVVAAGAAIAQRVMLGPIAFETAVIVIEREQGASGGSFAYATTKGHPERGIASFEVRRAENQVKLIARAWSRAGNLAAVVGRPVSRYLQKAFTNEAVAYFCANAS